MYIIKVNVVPGGTLAVTNANVIGTSCPGPSMKLIVVGAGGGGVGVGEGAGSVVDVLYTYIEAHFDGSTVIVTFTG